MLQFKNACYAQIQQNRPPATWKARLGAAPGNGVAGDWPNDHFNASEHEHLEANDRKEAPEQLPRSTNNQRAFLFHLRWLRSPLPPDAPLAHPSQLANNHLNVSRHEHLEAIDRKSVLEQPPQSASNQRAFPLPLQWLRCPLHP